MLLKTSQWLKKPMYVLLVCVLIYMGAYAALYRASEYGVLQQQAAGLLGHGGRKLSFDKDVERRLLPRPTIILKHVRLTERDGSTEALRADEVRVGLSWSNLWGNQTVEKLVVSQFSGSLKRDVAGQWNISDMWQESGGQPEQAVRFNRIQLVQGRLDVQWDDERWLWHDLGFAATRGNDGFAYHWSAKVDAPQWEFLSLNGQGKAQWTGHQLTLPDAKVGFTGKEHGFDFSGSLNAAATWQPKQFQAQNVQFEWQSRRFDSTVNTTVARIDSERGQANVVGLNSIFKLHYGNDELNGSLSVPQVWWNNGLASSDSVAMSLTNHAPDGYKWNVGLQGSGVWRRATGLRLPQVKVTSLQTTPTNQTRFVSEWEGDVRWVQYKQWQLQAKGLFDRQPTEWSLVRRGDEISGSLYGSKLDLSQYWQDKKSETWTYPAWAEPELSVKLAVRVAQLQLPNLMLNQVDTNIVANAQAIEINPLAVDLYEGKSTGSLKIANTLPLSFAWQQRSENVLIEPLIQDVFGRSSFVGKGEVVFDVQSQGQTRQEWLQNLSGSLKLHVREGRWLGINFARLFRNTQDKTFASSSDKPEAFTPFRAFHLEGTIEQGISTHQIRAQLTEPVATLSSEGQANLYTGEILDEVLVSGRNAMPLPIRLSGPLSNPSVALNYQRLTEGSATPAEKKKMVNDAITQQLKWLQQENQSSQPNASGSAP